MDKAPEYPPPRYAGYVVVVLTVAYVFSFIDRQIVALLVQPIKQDLGLSDTQMSLLMGLAFGIFYTLMGIPLGRAADRFSRRAIIAGGIALWSLMTAACGLAKNYGQLFAARVGVGVGEASLTPSALSLISDYFPKEKRGRAIGFYNMGISIGAGVAMILGGLVISYAASAPEVVLPLVGEIRPWQLVFIIVGLPGLLISALMITVREPKRHGLIKSGQAGKSLPLGFIARYLLQRWRAFGGLFLGMSVVTIVGYAYFSWVPTMFIRNFGWSIQQVGLVYGILLLICGPLGVNLAGWLADTLYRKGQRDGHLKTVLAATILTLPTASLMPLMPTPELTVAMLIPASIGPAMATATGASSLMMITPNQMRGQASAIYMFVISILGLTVGPTAVALITDYVYADESALRYSIAWVSFAGAAISTVVLALSLKPYQQAIEESEGWSET
ncbi:MAG: MFS transporter [Xanthomonadales bacterium]|nr:MFS transporter [Xanthomonadales bacterium]